MKDKPYVVALYTRMSKEDDDVGLFGNKEESNSITNQGVFCKGRFYLFTKYT